MGFAGYTVAPDAATDPLVGYSFSYSIDGTRAVAVGNDARIWHSHTERVLPFFHVARTYA